MQSPSVQLVNVAKNSVIPHFPFSMGCQEAWNSDFNIQFYKKFHGVGGGGGQPEGGTDGVSGNSAAHCRGCVPA